MGKENKCTLGARKGFGEADSKSIARRKAKVKQQIKRQSFWPNFSIVVGQKMVNILRSIVFQKGLVVSSN